MIIIENIKEAPIGIIWETSLKDIGCLTVLFDGQAKPAIQEGDIINATFGPPGNMQRLRNYTVWRVRGRNRLEIIAFEFGHEWQAKTQAIYTGSRSVAIRQLISKRGERHGKIVVTGGDKTYTQSESDIAFLYRLAGNIPVWRDGEGAINVAYPPDVKVNQVIDIMPAMVTGKKYTAAGFTPDGLAFEVSVGDGVETRVANVFHSPAEARDYLERLAASDPKGKLICLGETGMRAGCNVILPDGTRRRVTKCKHEVKHEAWTVAAYLN